MTEIAVSPTAPQTAISTGNDSRWPYFLLFFLSGFPALLYQIVWQRALFTIYGVNVESVTVIVTIFMIGLGLGSLAGGRLSTALGGQALRAFGCIEVSIGIFGVFSLSLFGRVAHFTAGSSTPATALIVFLLLLVPTLLMGSTLPLLVAHLVRRNSNVGESVGSLYAANTFGSGAACLLAALVLMRVLGESGSVTLAASLNLLVGTAAIIIPGRNWSPQMEPASNDTSASHKTIALWIAIPLSAATGFIALAYEIIWYRLYSFTSGGTAPCFAKLLAFYLCGVAYGALAVHDICKQKLKDDLQRTLRAGSIVLTLGAVTAFLLGPALSLLVRFVSYDLTFPLVSIAAALMGAAFPILSHAAIGPTERAGKELSYIYVSNIAGSALGSFLIGFVVLDHWSTRAASLLLLGIGLMTAAILAALAKPAQTTKFFGAATVFFLIVIAASGPLFGRIYERLLYKGEYDGRSHFRDLIENRSGVIAVDSKETVYGGGSYDGHFNTDLVNDTNGIFRAYAIAGLHPAPKQVLVIGLSSGSWAQIIANHPMVEDVTIVEINPGYIPLIQERPGVASLLRNPKVHIVIDDGRRWLTSHPDRRFDLILMNTTFHFRAHVSNLLSVEFLQLVHQHLKPGGIEYYNTTRSEEAQLAATKVFPYAVRVSTFIAVGDQPIVFNSEQFKAILQSYKIAGRPVLDMSDSTRGKYLEHLLSQLQADRDHAGNRFDDAIEDRSQILPRLRGLRPITDDNMGAEWKTLPY